MSSADRWVPVGASTNWLRTYPKRYGFAILAVIVATLARYALGVAFGLLPPFLLFFPTIIVVGLLAGFWPSVVATLLSTVSIAFFFLAPLNQFGVSRRRDDVWLGLFTVIGLVISGLAGLYRRREGRLREFERVVEGLEEMIVVVDREYRCLIANRAFLTYRGMKREGLIGRSVLEVLNPGVFETTVKQKLVESFQGKTVRYEMRYKYPDRGERDLVITYFPIEGPDGVDRVASVLQDVTEQKQAEISLKLFRKLIDQSNDAVEVIDPETLRLLDVNEKACKDLGYTREELLSMSVYDFDPNADKSCRATLIEALREKGSIVKQATHRRKDGSTFPVEASLKFVQLDRSYVVAVARDISDRRKAEEAVRESEDRYRDLVEHCEDLVCTHDLEGRLLSVNPAPARILGYDPAELVRIPMRDMIVPEYRDLFDGYLARIKETGSDRGLMVVMTRTGERRTWEYSNTLRTDGVAAPVVRGMAHDVTERRRAELALQSSEQRYRMLFEKTVAGVAIIGMDGFVIDCNDAWARMFGYGVASECRGRQLAACYPDPRDRQKFLQELRRCGALLNREMEMRRKDGTPLWLLLNSVLLTDEKGQSVIQSTISDISPHKRAEEALRSSEQRYRMLFEKNLAGVAIASLEGQVLQCNDAWARILGYSAAEEIQGRSTKEFYFDPTDRQPLLDELTQIGALFGREMQLRRKDGTPVWVLFNSVVAAGADGAPLVQGTLIDISRRKVAEQALQRREEDYRRFVAQSSEGIFRQDLDAPLPVDLPEDELVRHILHDSYLAECNEAIGKMYGITAQEFVGKRLTETVDPEDPRNIELTREYIRSGFRVLERESHENDVHGNPKVFRNSMIGIVENGKLLRTWGIQRDVTEQVKAEEARTEAEKALRKSEEHFRILVEQASDGIFIADAQGRYLDVNSAGVEMLGYTREEILHFSIADIIEKDEIPRLAPEVARFDGGQVARSEWKFRRKDGSIFPGEVCGKRLPDGRLQGILRDMTDRKRAEEKMRRSEERFRVALKDSPITVFNQDRDLRYTWIYNPQFYWQQDAIGKTDEEIIGSKKAAVLSETKKRVLNSSTAAREEVAVSHNGNNLVFDMTIEPLFDSDRNVVGITGSYMDIARLREMTDRLQEAKDKLVEEKLYLESEIRTELGFKEIIGQSPALREVLKKTRIVAPTDSTVLLLGETGTGKELIARSVHSLSARREQNFVKLNCAAVPSGLLESELFGHEKGAFTGAVSKKIGRIELADKGTLFLDEIGELPLELQPKLLRVLQDREFERLGGVQTLHVNVRIISATNRDLRQDIADRKFREDLFYRLNVFPIELPPLRERRDDIPVLVRHFVHKHAKKMGKHIDAIPDEVMHTLRTWSWPGNIRELENMIERMVILSKSHELAAPPAELEDAEDLAEDNLIEIEREHIIRVLRETNGVLSGADGAASRLGIKRTTLQSMIKRLGIESQEYRRAVSTFGK